MKTEITPDMRPAEKLNIFSLSTVQMRTFHTTWLTFFACFFGWFGLAPLMPTIREDLNLSKGQVGNIIIASISATIIARLFIGRLCDTWGPRKTYTALLVLCSIPVFLVGLSNSYETFLLFRFAIGIIGASFVITQYHTSVMFAPSIKGTANAVAGGWGNLGGGVTNIVMPLVFAWIVSMGYSKHDAWRYAMILPGMLLLMCAFLYYRFTQDSPEGNYEDLTKEKGVKEKSNWQEVVKDWRVWALTFAYAMSFGMEITFDNIASLYFVDNFKVDQKMAGLLAGTFGLMNIFARAMGGIIADKIGKVKGLIGKGHFLAFVLGIQGLGLILFSQANTLSTAIAAMIGFALFLKMANGATYAITPFMNTKNMGVVAGIVGAGGNIGGMLMGFMFKSSNITYGQAFFYIGVIALIVAALVGITNFSKSPSVAADLSAESIVTS
jgi:MFS transporter, NNP family, nitrate/nitrite transporter